MGDGELRRLMNFEIREILEETDILGQIKAQRIRWFGHIKRMDCNRDVRRITEWKPDGRRSRGRPQSKWEDQVINDIIKMGIHGWRNKILNRTTWRKIVDEAKTINWT